MNSWPKHASLPRNSLANFQKQRKGAGEGILPHCVPPALPLLAGLGRSLKAARFQQLVQFKAKSMRNLLQRQQTGIRLNPKLVKLVELVADTAGFGGLLLCPTAPLPQFAKSSAEPC